MRVLFTPRVLHLAPAWLPDGVLGPRTPHQVVLLHPIPKLALHSFFMSLLSAWHTPGHYSIYPLRLGSPGSSLTSRSEKPPP